MTMLGPGTVTSKSVDRSDEGTTFEASCYTDPLGIEHLTGAMAECIRFFGEWAASVQLRFTTKFDAVGGLVGLKHNGRTRVQIFRECGERVTGFRRRNGFGAAEAGGTEKDGCGRVSGRA